MKPIFVEKNSGSSIITEKDPYILGFSEFDLQSRLGTSAQVSLVDLLNFLPRQCLDWNPHEINKISLIFRHLNKAYDLYKKYIFDEIPLIKTSGAEESNAAYTRGKHIYIPNEIIQWNTYDLTLLIAHELFHIVSTHNLEFRKNWYAKLGFIACPDLRVPKEYKKLSVSNPDTIGKNCYLEIKDNGDSLKAVPFLFSTRSYQGGYFFRYFRFSYLACEIEIDKCIPIYQKEALKFIEPPPTLYDLCEEIKPFENQHRLHPEEILAYYWSTMSIPKSELPPFMKNYYSKILDIIENQKNFKIFNE
jgi:hypothetical protein